LTGLLLKESLVDDSVLELVNVVKVEVWDVNNAAPCQPKTWTAIIFEAEKERAPDLAEAFSKILKPEGWYINFSTGDKMYVIFPQNIFCYQRGDTTSREEAIVFGRSLNIPESQLDWGD
jgi:hypothetical protein